MYDHAVVNWLLFLWSLISRLWPTAGEQQSVSNHHLVVNVIQPSDLYVYHSADLTFKSQDTEVSLKLWFPGCWATEQPSWSVWRSSAFFKGTTGWHLLEYSISLTNYRHEIWNHKHRAYSPRVLILFQISLKTSNSDNAPVVSPDSYEAGHKCSDSKTQNDVVVDENKLINHYFQPCKHVLLTMTSNSRWKE